MHRPDYCATPMRSRSMRRGLRLLLRLALVVLMSLALAATSSTTRGEGRGCGGQTWRIGDPPDTLALRAHWGQVMPMVLSHDAVIVRLGWAFRRGQFDKCAFVASFLKLWQPELRISPTSEFHPDGSIRGRTRPRSTRS